MKIPNITGLYKVGRNILAANRPEILFGASVTATITSVVLAGKGGYEARGIVEATERDRLIGPGTTETPLTFKEKAQLTWQCYIPAAVGTISAVGSTTGLHIAHVSDKKKMATAALAAIDEVRTSSEAYAEDLREAYEENFRVTDEKREKVATSILEKNADRNGGIAYVQDTDGLMNEFYIVRDAKSGRDIWSNENRIEDAVNRVNQQLSYGEDIPLNEFYNLAGYGELHPEGEDVGWSGGLIEVSWDTTKRDDGRPVRQFSFRQAPSSSYGATHR